MNGKVDSVLQYMLKVRTLKTEGKKVKVMCKENDDKATKILYDVTDHSPTPLHDLYVLHKVHCPLDCHARATVV